MGRYIGWNSVVDRYPTVDTRGSATEVGSAFISPVENQLDGLFAGHFTVPFSSNNMTVKDLAIDMVYLRASRMSAEDKKALQDGIMERIDSIKMGNESMLLDDGSVLTANVDGTIYSSTKSYVPVFGMLDTTKQEIDPDLIDDEEDDRGYYS